MISLDTVVADGIKQELVNQAEEIVYGAYDPIIYNRRGSLIDESNYQIDKSGDMSLTVIPVASFNPAYGTSNGGNQLAGLVNYGNGWGGYSYDFTPRSKPATYKAPRPFIDYTKELLAEGMFKDLLEEGLLQQGLDVR